MATKRQKAAWLDDVKKAYVWEQAQIAHWGSVTRNFDDRALHNPIQQRFKAIWDNYFEEVSKSNKKILEIIAKGDTDAAIKRINSTEHLRLPLWIISNTAQAADFGGFSKYFRQLYRLMNLEVNARDSVEKYLTNGTLPPAP